MREAKICMHGIHAGILKEVEMGKQYEFSYLNDYKGPYVSLTMNDYNKKYEYDEFPPLFDGLLPEGMMLESLLKQKKIDRDDLFSQLISVGEDLVGAISVKEKM